jgi:hypothetical protein
LRLKLPAKSGMPETRREEYSRKDSDRKRASYAVARASLDFQVVKAQIKACGYTGLKASPSGGVVVQAKVNGKQTYIGTFSDVHAAARAYNDVKGALPGGRYYNDVE